MQSRVHSMLEACFNVGTGFLLSWILQAYLVPILWPTVSTTKVEAFWITMMFTGVSLVRVYALRRLFVRMHQ